MTQLERIKDLENKVAALGGTIIKHDDLPLDIQEELLIRTLYPASEGLAILREHKLGDPLQVAA